MKVNALKRRIERLSKGPSNPPDWLTTVHPDPEEITEYKLIVSKTYTGFGRMEALVGFAKRFRESCPLMPLGFEKGLYDAGERLKNDLEFRKR